LSRKTEGLLVLGLFVLLALAQVSESAPSPVPSTLSAGPDPPQLTVLQYNTTVPAKYQSNYTTLENILDGFNASLGPTPLSPNKFAYSASLVPADGNQGPTLLGSSNQNTVNANLDAYQAMGVQEVEISIPYPLLSPGFPNSSQYLNYYTQLVQTVHSRGMKALVESHVAFVGTGFSSLNYSFRGLAYSDFVTGVAAQDQLIISKVKPDYIDIGTEADTEAGLTGYHQLDTASGWTSFIEQLLSSLSKDGSPTKIGAGAGTWNGIQFMQGFVNNPNLDFLTTHIYPLYDGSVVGDPLQTLIQMGQLAQQNNKRIIISEFWPETVTSPSPPPGTGVGGEFADHQEVWGFTTGIDAKTLELVAKFSEIYPVELLNAFSEQYFFAHLNYTPQLDSEGYFTLDNQINQLWAQNMRTYTVTPTGEEYASLASASQGQNQTTLSSTTSQSLTTHQSSSTSETTAKTPSTTSTVVSSTGVGSTILSSTTLTSSTESSGAITEFPYQLAAVAVLTALIAGSYVIARRKLSHQNATPRDIE